MCPFTRPHTAASPPERDRVMLAVARRPQLRPRCPPDRLPRTHHPPLDAAPDWQQAREVYDAGVGARGLAEAQSLFVRLLRRFELPDEFVVEDVKDAIALLGKVATQVPKPIQRVDAEVTLTKRPALPSGCAR